MPGDFAAMLPLHGRVFGNFTCGGWRAAVVDILEPGASDRVSYDVEFTQIRVGESGAQPNRTLRLTVSHAGLATSTYDPNRSDSYQRQILLLVEDWIVLGRTTAELQYFGN
jgi:hypothetical protein